MQVFLRCPLRLLSWHEFVSRQQNTHTGRCDQHTRLFTGNETATLVEMLNPAGRVVSIKPPSSTARLRGRVVTWGGGLLQPQQMSWALFKYLTNHLRSSRCCWDALVMPPCNPKPLPKSTMKQYLEDIHVAEQAGSSGVSKGWGFSGTMWKGLHIHSPARINPPPSDDWRRWWGTWLTGSSVNSRKWAMLRHVKLDI